MKLYLVSQSANDKYDTYDSFVCAAPTEDIAGNMNPRDGEPVNWEHIKKHPYSEWAFKVTNIRVEYLGETEKPQGVICASYNAG